MRYTVFAAALAAPLAAALAASAVQAAAQTVIRTQPRAVIAQNLASSDDPKRAMLGISTSSSGRRDTLGLLVTSVTAGGPAERAGLEEGNRLVSINGVSLKLSRDDADDDFMQGVNQNRLSREMRKVKAGDDVTLEVYGAGRTRSIKVKSVSAEDMSPKRASTWTTLDADRAALGLYLTTTGSKRDTAGVFVQQVVDGGPADKAGIYEGDHIASINGVDLRVPREDAGDWGVSSSRVDRLEREVRKLTVGQTTDLVVVSGGRSRSVKVTAVKATELPGGYAYSFRTGPDGGFRFMGPGGSGMFALPKDREIRIAPKIRIQRGVDDWDDHFNFDFDKHFDFDFDKLFDFKDFDHKFEDFKFDFDNFKWEFNNNFKRDFDNNVRWKLEDNLRDVKNLGPKIRAEVDAAIRDVRIRGR